MKSTMSILGLYNWDPTIFDGMALPAQMNTAKTTLINNLMMECAEFEVLYPDPEFMKSAISAWSGIMVGVWEKLYATTQYDYDPISNYDRHEKWEDTDTRTETNIRTPNLSETTQLGSINTQAQNSYENAGMVDAIKSTNSGSDIVNTTGTETNALTRGGKLVREGRAYGNIGVTTTQDMINQERETVKFNMFRIIIEDFKDRFCLMIY